MSLSRAQDGASYSFDVVSIRVSDGSGLTFYGASADTYTAKNMPLAIVLEEAFYPRAYERRDALEGAPDWVWRDRYTFIGKVSAEDMVAWKKEHAGWSPNTAAPLLQGMLRAALKDRCHLAVHTVPGTIDGYALVLSKGGPNFKHLVKSTPGETIPSDAQPTPLGGHIVPYIRGNAPVVHYYDTSMPSLAANSAQLHGAPVVDRTGLAGSYDFALSKMDEKTADASEMWDWGALGLKLVRIKLPYMKIHVDHMDRPTLN
ncbi:TIGR03435 family protein [Silvibacterium sp.]|uniref:TIGR03435 family protein n=1 Tax=Silvibacterium sp. TaxID=1964179 RepID=UPI0039E4EEF4